MVAQKVDKSKGGKLPRRSSRTEKHQDRACPSKRRDRLARSVLVVQPEHFDDGDKDATKSRQCPSHVLSPSKAAEIGIII